eukprot:TRINITY_DN34298_c0_g1_i1.p1 TRINITY_DN34298_c0_g1~~TRINITY_DN34298_c0_g1_i1.p1  ORF type:complete len:184 (-),score=16.80 TRINITY_DN34298_c0_g1_i1:57-608(-)
MVGFGMWTTYFSYGRRQQQPKPIWALFSRTYLSLPSFQNIFNKFVGSAKAIARVLTFRRCLFTIILRCVNFIKLAILHTVPLYRLREGKMAVKVFVDNNDTTVLLEYWKAIGEPCNHIGNATQSLSTTADNSLDAVVFLTHGLASGDRIGFKGCFEPAEAGLIHPNNPNAHETRRTRRLLGLL